MPKLSIYLPDASVARLNDPDNVSGRIAQIIDNYDAIVADAMPHWPFETWRTLAEHYLRAYATAEPAPVRLLWAGITDDPQVPDAATLAQQLKMLPFASLVAVNEVLEQCRKAGKGGVAKVLADRNIKPQRRVAG